MTGKRPHPDSEGLFLSRKGVSDITNGDIEAPGSYIVGKIFSKNPNKNQYTVDIRRDSNSKAVYLDVVIEDKLQKRLELLVGDLLHISLKGAQVLPHSGPASHVPVVLRFREGITILLVSRAGPQGEKGKLFHVWPIASAYLVPVSSESDLLLGVDTNKAKKRRSVLDTDDNWFPTPPPGNAMESAPTSQAAISHSGNSQSVSRSPSLPPSSIPPPSPTTLGHSQSTNDAESSTSGATRLTPRQTTPKVRTRTGATYAYRTTPSNEEFAPIDITFPPKSPTATGSATTAHPMLGEASPDVNQPASAFPAQSSSEQQNDDGGIVLRFPQPMKSKSARRKKRDEVKRQVAAAQSPPAEIVPAAPTILQTEDVSMHNVGQTGSSVVSARGETGDEQDMNGTAKESSGDDDDPDLNMRAGLIVNGVRIQRQTVAFNDDVPSQWPYTPLSEIRDRALMSVIGVVSSVGKESTRTASGGTKHTSRAY